MVTSYFYANGSKSGKYEELCIKCVFLTWKHVYILGMAPQYGNLSFAEPMTFDYPNWKSSILGNLFVDVFFFLGGSLSKPKKNRGKQMVTVDSG